jgi:nucleoside-diphosphate-sugar epimerase
MSMSKPTILITGSNGYLGNILVSKLMQSKARYRDADILGGPHSNTHHIDFESVIAYDNLMYGQTSLTEYCYRGDFEFVYGRVQDTVKLKEQIKKADIIIPLAAIVGFPACEKDPELAWAVNYNQIEWILDHTSSDQRIIMPSTNSGYGIGQEDNFCTEETPLNPISVYGMSKTAAERLILDKQRGITLRLATVFGISNRQRLDLLCNDFVYKAVNDGYLFLFEKDFKRNFIHIQDVALTFIYMMNHYEFHFGQTFNVGLSSANISKYELALKIKEQIPDLYIHSSNIKSDPDKRNYIVSNAKLEATGWQPYYSLEQGIEELRKAYNIIIPNNQKFTNL